MRLDGRLPNSASTTFAIALATEETSASGGTTSENGFCTCSPNPV